MTIQYALFDFDGTLIDSNEAVISSLNHVAINFRGTPFGEDELNLILGKPIVDQMAILSVEKVDLLVEQYRLEYRRVMDALTKIYDGVIEMLTEIKALGIYTGVVSNKGRRGIDHGVHQFDLHDLIDVTVSLDDVNTPKPHEEGLYKAVHLIHKKFGLNQPSDSDMKKIMKRTVFVGDSGHDIETAKNAACLSVLVDWTLIDMKQLMKLNPDYVIDSPGALLKIIRSLT
ncbi:MAG TPA: hypothetical protein DCS67_06600 [Clostridiales bacterium UBA8960]|jgi:pyrophosphatase PpaX|nr:hypothetical protein [Clostridiales bacterium UBA8960]